MRSRSSADMPRFRPTKTPTVTMTSATTSNQFTPKAAFINSCGCFRTVNVISNFCARWLVPNHGATPGACLRIGFEPKTDGRRLRMLGFQFQEADVVCAGLLRFAQALRIEVGRIEMGARLGRIIGQELLQLVGGVA